MRDFTIDECKRRNNIISTIKNCFENWGYNEISTPTVEYYETFNHKIQSLKEEEMYKFFDNRGRILTLRPDMTVPTDERHTIHRFTGKAIRVRHQFRFQFEIHTVNGCSWFA